MSTLTGLVDRMEKKGLVRGRRDRRAIEPEATPAGRVALTEHARGIEAIARGMLEALPEADQTALLGLLRRIRERIELARAASSAPYVFFLTLRRPNHPKEEECDETHPRHANGHVGNNVCRELVRKGTRVRAMMRASADPAPLEGLVVEIVRGDVTNAADVARAVEGCGTVHHTAAGFLMWARDPEREIIRPSIEGTRLVLEAARKAGVERVVYTSSGGTIGHAPSPDMLLDEKTFTEHPHTYYLQGKCAAEKEALALAKRTGLQLVVVSPGLILGPRFWKASESVRQVEQFLNQGAPAYFDGGFPVVDVEDVAVGMVLAMEKGRSGERSILSGENVTVKQLFDLMSELTGIPAPKLKLPVPVLRLAATAMEFASKLTGSRPMLDRSQVDEFAGKWGCLTNAKAAREVGMSFRNARETVSRTVAWCLSRGFVKESRRAAIHPHPSLATVEVAR